MVGENNRRRVCSNSGGIRRSNCKHRPNTTAYGSRRHVVDNNRGRNRRSSPQRKNRHRTENPAAREFHGKFLKLTACSNIAWIRRNIARRTTSIRATGIRRTVSNNTDVRNRTSKLETLGDWRPKPVGRLKSGWPKERSPVVTKETDSYPTNDHRDDCGDRGIRRDDRHGDV
uniref:Uncharacterized protein n=1 Tax=Romanomermis culicivorax TaxID=13658 RepID=A0A915HZV4_ROMCU